jgi:hypothetical protein
MLSPTLKTKYPKHYDMLNDQHTTMQTFLNDINNAISHLKEKNNDLVFLRQLKTALLSLDKMWHPHIKIEEAHFTPERLENLIKLEEMINLHQKFSQFSMEPSEPDY